MGVLGVWELWEHGESGGYHLNCVKGYNNKLIIAQFN